MPNDQPDFIQTERFDDAVAAKRWAYLLGGALNPECDLQLHWCDRFKELTGIHVAGSLKERGDILKRWAKS